jgi:hypothetical protein
MTAHRFARCSVTVLAFSAAAAMAAAQSAPPSSGAPSAASTPSSDSTAKKKAAPPAKGAKGLTLSGCVQPEAGKNGTYTLTDEKTGTTYHLTGTSVKPYVWRHVEIVGGLVPSATMAAQAGAAFDPVKAAEAAEARRPGVDTAPTVVVRVNRVQALTGGTCPPKTD